MEIIFKNIKVLDFKIFLLLRIDKIFAKNKQSEWKSEWKRQKRITGTFHNMETLSERHILKNGSVLFSDQEAHFQPCSKVFKSLESISSTNAKAIGNIDRFVPESL